MSALTNSTALSYAIETTPGVLSGAEDWYYLEPNDIGSFGASITTVARNPISNDRMAKKGAITDLDSSLEFDSDLTRSSFNNFIEGFLFADKKVQADSVVASCDTDTFTHASITALSAGDLVFTREMLNTENNGLFLVNGVPAATTTPVDATLVAEGTAPTDAKLEYAGFQAAAGDLVIDASGDLTCTTFDFTTDVTGAGLLPGMFIYVGDGTATHSFFTAGSGTARIRAVAAKKLTLDRQNSSTWAADDGTDDSSGGTPLAIQVFVGSWIRNVPLDHGDFLNRTYQFEAKYTELDVDGDGDEDDIGYEYAKGNNANQITLNLPLTDKATVNWAFVGTDQEEASGTRKTTSGDWFSKVDTDAFNTTSDFGQIYFANESGDPLGAYFKDMTISINNNVNPEKILGLLGAKNMNIGDFEIGMTTQVLFTSLAAINAVRNNETISFSFNVENDDGALHFDIPSLTLGGATKSFARNETIKLDLDGTAFKDNFFGYVISITDFPYLPIVG